MIKLQEDGKTWIVERDKSYIEHFSTKKIKSTPEPLKTRLKRICYFVDSRTQQIDSYVPCR